MQQRQGRWLRAASEFEFDGVLHLDVNVGLHVEVGVDSDVSYSDSSSGMRRVRSVRFCFT